MNKGTLRRWMVTGVTVTTLVTVALPTLAHAAGDAHVSTYIVKDPIPGAVALPTSTIQPYLTKIVAGLAPLESTSGVAHVATDGWISKSNGIEVIVEIGAFTQTIVNPTVQAQTEVLVSCKSATGVTPKTTTSLKGIPGSTEAQCTNKKGVRLSTSIGWSNANVIVLDLITGTTKSVAQEWTLKQFKKVPATGIVVETPTSLSSQYAAATDPMYNAMNTWLLKFQAWANVNGTAAQAIPFDNPYAVGLNTCAAKLTSETWSGTLQPKIDAVVKALKVLATHVDNLAVATPATASAWGKTYAVDQLALLTALTTAQRATR